MQNKKKWMMYGLSAALVAVVLVYGQKDRPSVTEAKAYEPQPLIVLDGSTIVYNDAPDCH